MLVLGIDPGVARMGCGVISQVGGGKLTVLEATLLETSPQLKADKRLHELYQMLKVYLKKYRPDSMALEKIFHGTNTKTVVAVGQAMGVVMLAAAEESVPLQEYTPLQVKMAVTGYGSADKGQVQKMVMHLLGLSEVPKPDDVADALAVAICHIHSAKIGALV